MRIFIFLILFTSCVSVFAQEVEIKNVKYKVDGEHILISYDLSGPPESEYLIEVYLRRESKENLRAELKSSSGAVGEGMFYGRNNKIIWKILEQYPGGLEGDDFFFEITAEDLDSGGSWVWWPLGLGTAGGLGYLAYILFFKDDTKETISIPLPPVRPSGN